MFQKTTPLQEMSTNLLKQTHRLKTFSKILVVT